MRIYLASSWRNESFEDMRRELYYEEHDVYNFRATGFKWSRYTSEAQCDVAVEYRRLLGMVSVEQAYETDYKALESADAVIMLLPCGNSSHLEAGWAIARGIPTAAFMNGQPVDLDLMYRMFGLVTDSYSQLFAWLRSVSSYRAVLDKLPPVSL